jgi:RNA polymerase sigma-70 factor, ECF subfamily
MTATCIESTVDLILAEESHLHGVARRLTRCRSDSDDLVQETLLRAYHARERFRPGTSVRAWTTTILRRLFLTGAIRARRRKLQTDTDSGRTLDSAVGRNSSPHGDPAPDVEALGESLDDVIKQALDRVPEVYRTTFFLSVVWDMSCEEIGRKLRVRSGTVASRVHRARERLRGDLAPHRRTLLASVSRHRI